MKTTNLGQKLKEQREIKGISQKKAAEELNISITCYAGYEQNYRDPDLEMLKKLSIFYNTSSDYLIGLENEDGTKINNTQKDTINNTYNNYGIHNGKVKF